MPVWEWIFIAAGVVVVVTAVLLAASFVSRRNKTQRLKQHYGREYERLVSQAGDQKAAEKELTARERKREKLDIIPLTPSALSDFTTAGIRCRPRSSITRQPPSASQIVW